MWNSSNRQMCIRDSDYYSHRAQIGFKQVTANYTYDIGVAAVPSSSQSIDLINSDRNIPKRTVFNVAPYLRYRYKMGKQRSLRIDYRGYSSQPSMNQLQPVEDRSDPLRIVVGNPELKPAFQNWLDVYKRQGLYHPGIVEYQQTIRRQYLR